jgi:WD40 repeat protein
VTISHAVLTGHQDPVRSVAFSYHSKLLATGGDDKSVILWLVTTHVSQWEFKAGNQRPDPPVRRSNLTGHQGRLRSVAFSPDRQLLATGSDDKDAMLWGVEDATTPEPLATLTDHKDQVSSVAFSPDGRLLATASADGTAILYHVRM